MATIDDPEVPVSRVDASESRVSEDPDGSMIRLNWEVDDEIVLREDGSGKEYTFKAVRYVYSPTSAEPDRISLYTAGQPLGANEEIVYFFEYKGTTPIDNATNFTGKATYKPRDSYCTTDSEGRLIFHQTAPGNADHLKACETLEVTLTGVNLTREPGAWTNPSVGLKMPVVFNHTSDYAYLKITTHGFRYPVFGKGTLSVYVMDETPDNVHDYYIPDAQITFGQIGDEFISLPSPIPSEDLDSFTGAYTGKLTCVFYVPLPKMLIKPSEYANPYIDVVLQCGKYGDLYVWEKKVPYDVLRPSDPGVELAGGMLYDLDYTDKRTEFALKIIDDLIYLRSTYLEQDKEGMGGIAPRYTLFGEKAEIGGTANNPNCALTHRATGYDQFNADDVKKMRLNSGAFKVSETPMVSIRARNDQHWKMNTTTGEWIKSGSNLQLVSDTLTSLQPHVTMDYMSKLTKGVVNTCGQTHGGMFRSNNCYEYVLHNEFDAVMNSPKISNLWRTPYAADLFALTIIYVDTQIPMYAYFSYDSSKNVLIIESAKTGHKICLPKLTRYKAENIVKSTKFDGTGSSPGTWQYDSSLIEYLIISASRSVRSAGSGNPAYFQMVSIVPNFTTTPNSCATLSKFDVAAPILPVFRWKTSSTSNNLVLWSEINSSFTFTWDQTSDPSKFLE